MADELLTYYERELRYLRKEGAEFAEAYPAIASLLRLEPGRCDDPHVERMIEAVAFLSARIHRKLDDEFPQITEALMNIVYPHLLRPVPSMAVAEFQLDPEQGRLTEGIAVPRGTMLNYRYPQRQPDWQSENAPRCKFQTCFETNVLPLDVTRVEWFGAEYVSPSLRTPNTSAVLRLQLRCLSDIGISDLQLDSLRLYVYGEPILYEMLCNNCTQIVIKDPKVSLDHAFSGGRAGLVLRPAPLKPVGFSEDEAILPYPRRSFTGYRLLQEYFAFPDKFLFIELGSLARLPELGLKNDAEVLFLIAEFEPAGSSDVLNRGISPSSLRLNCTPIVNLFPTYAEPIRVDHTRSEYPVIPDARGPRVIDIFSVDEVLSTKVGSTEVVRLEPAYSSRYASRSKKQPLWYTRRELASGPDSKADHVYLSLLDDSLLPLPPEMQTLTVRCTCTNGDLPRRLPFGKPEGDFDLDSGTSMKKISASNPTAALKPPVGRHTLWHLISQLSLNYLSLVDEGKAALQEILKLHNLAGSASVERQIDGIEGLRSARCVARVTSEEGSSFARGTSVEIEFDAERFVGGNVYLFASVLEQFLGLYVSMNSFSQLTAKTRQRKVPIRQWPPRAGDTILI